MTSGTNPVGTWQETNYNTQTGTSYPLQIDANNAVAQRIVDQFAPHQATSPNMTVVIDAGSIFNGTTLTEVAQQTSATITAPTGSNKRIDRIVVSASTGTISVITGTPTTGTPSAPAITAGNLPVAQTGVMTSSTTALTNNMIVDERNFWGISSLSALLDSFFGNTEGDILQRGSAGWQVLAPGSANQILTSGGSAALNSWAGLSSLLDSVFGNTQGNILYRGSSAWQALAPGTNGDYLQTQGSGANPQWSALTAPTKGTPLTVNPYALGIHTSGAHGLGATPTFVVGYIECITTNQGFSVGSRIYNAGGLGGSYNTAPGISFSADSTNVYINTEGDTDPYILKQSDSSIVQITPADWKIVAIPYL